MVSTIAGTEEFGYNGDNIPATSALLSYTSGLAVDSINNLVYIADTTNHRIRVVNCTSVLIDTFAGTGEHGYNGDNIPATSAMLYTPFGVTLTAPIISFILQTQEIIAQGSFIAQVA
ncbi:hypothetical protein AKO1_000900 [Acrasis kona]|uniref:NHL repeat-containing protein n=1 Tax=Acrasis kona TaxID=1008807 RepID=A0AAW2ZRQ2_9EUKA